MVAGGCGARLYIVQLIAPDDNALTVNPNVVLVTETAAPVVRLVHTAFAPPWVTRVYPDC